MTPLDLRLPGSDLSERTLMTDSSAQQAPSAAEKVLGDFAPGLVHFTDDVLFGDV